MTNKAQAKESAVLRNQRIEGTNNGSTLRTRVVKDKKKYNRNLKHKKSFALAEDFPFIKGKLREKQAEIARWRLFSDEKGSQYRIEMNYYTKKIGKSRVALKIPVNRMFINWWFCGINPVIFGKSEKK